MEKTVVCVWRRRSRVLIIGILERQHLIFLYFVGNFLQKSAVKHVMQKVVSRVKRFLVRTSFWCNLASYFKSTMCGYSTHKYDLKIVCSFTFVFFTFFFLLSFLLFFCIMADNNGNMEISAPWLGSKSLISSLECDILSVLTSQWM